MITKFGQYLRELRLQRNVILKQMADSLGVSSAFLSAVEHGKKKIPQTWSQKIASLYHLSLKEESEMNEAILASRKTILINLEKSSEMNRKAAICFARSFNTLNDQESQAIIHILQEKEHR